MQQQYFLRLIRETRHEARQQQTRFVFKWRTAWSRLVRCTEGTCGGSSRRRWRWRRLVKMYPSLVMNVNSQFPGVSSNDKRRESDSPMVVKVIPSFDRRT